MSKARKRGRMRPQWKRTKSAFREALTYELPLLTRAAGFGLYAAARALAHSRRPASAFNLLMRLHSSGLATSLDTRIEALVREATLREKRGISSGLWARYDEVIRQTIAAFLAGHNPNPSRLIGSRLLVVKRARPGERGVLFVDYSYVFPLLAGVFDLAAIANRYFIVLEPSWRGVCAPEVLLFSRLNAPVLVETIEPRDIRLLEGLNSNLSAVPVAANFWVDHRRTHPSRSRRDIDVIMVAAWAAVKRHSSFFRAVKQLRDRGNRLTVALVGYPYDKTMADVFEEARAAGIDDQVQLFEGLSPESVAALLGRAKIKVLWSRQECANRAIIEAMLADVPVIVRSGLTYGYRYPYINEHTGRFVEDENLGQAMLEMIQERDGYAPREWVLNHMTPERAMLTIEQSLQRAANELGENWSEGLTLKSSSLHTQHYWHEEDRHKFDNDYSFLESALRRR